MSRVLRLLLIASLWMGSVGNAALWAAPANDPEAGVLRAIKLLNQIPEEQVDEKADPTFSIIRSLYDVDGPEFLTLRKLVGQASVRATMNPSSKSVIAGILSTRWDSFALAGNLWLASFGSRNEDIRNRARRKLVQFIQPAHVPALIEMLRMPGTNVQVYQVLWEVTGQTLDANINTWRTWWTKNQKHVDLVGHLLKDTKEQLYQHPVTPFAQERFWYLPDGVSDASIPFEKRGKKEQQIITDWNAWAAQDVKRYVEAWRVTKPILDRITHQPDPRVTNFLERLSTEPGYGDYLSVVLAWRANATSLPAVQKAYKASPSVGRALARGSLGDKTALRDLLQIIEDNPAPLSFRIMDDDSRALMDYVRTVGILPAEQAFELLAHQSFDFDGAETRSQKKRAIKKAHRWVSDNYNSITLDRRRGYFRVQAR